MDRHTLTSPPRGLSDTVPSEHRSLSTVVDEANFFDLWLVLARRKWVLAAVIVISVVVGLTWALLTPSSYIITTPVEVGTFSNASDPIESIETVRVKLVDGYIPQVLHEHFKENPSDTNRYQIKAEVPRNSLVLVLRSKGSADQVGGYIALHKNVVSRLVQDHKRIQDVLRKDLEIKIENRKQNLAELKDRAKILRTLLGRLEDERKLLAKEIDYLTQTIVTADQNRRSQIEEVSTDVPGAMTLLMLTNEFRHSRTRLTELERRISVGLANERDDLLKRLADNQRAQTEEQVQIEKLRLQLENMRETRAVLSPMRSLEPVGLGKKAIVVLSALIGLFLGILAVLVFEFVAKEKAYRRAKAV